MNPLSRMLVCLGAAAGIAGSSSLMAQTTAQPSTAPAPSTPKTTPAKTAEGAARQINWDALVPPDWNPTSQMKGANLGMLSDGDPRAVAMLKTLREAWDKAPTNNEIDGQRVRLPGYIVPLEEGQSGMKEFLLVPYFGACIHTPPPPANQIVHVMPKQPARGFRSMDTVWISGTLKALRSDTSMGASGYRMEADLVEPYVEKPR